MAFTNFYINSYGDYLNSGHTSGTPYYNQSGYCTWNSNTETLGVPQSPIGIVSTGDFISIFPHVTGISRFFARITAMTTGSITVSTTVRCGTEPSSGNQNMGCRVGGAWFGPSGNNYLPFGVLTNALVDTGSNPIAVWIKNDRPYRVEGTIPLSQTGPLMWVGYNRDIEDKQKISIIGGTTGTYGLINISATYNFIANMDVKHNGAASTNALVRCNGAGTTCYNISAKNGWGAGFEAVLGTTFIDCEASFCNSGNSVGMAGFSISASSKCIRCVSHHNVTQNGNGFHVVATSNSALDAFNCISVHNSGNGVSFATSAGTALLNLVNGDFSYNGLNGIAIRDSAATDIYIGNCNMIANSGFGIACTAYTSRNAIIDSCGFYGNRSGNINAHQGIFVLDTINYEQHPYEDGNNGDFRLVSSSGVGSAVGLLETMDTFTKNTKTVWNLGAAQSQSPGYSRARGI